MARKTTVRPKRAKRSASKKQTEKQKTRTKNRARRLAANPMPECGPLTGSTYRSHGRQVVLCAACPARSRPIRLSFFCAGDSGGRAEGPGRQKTKKESVRSDKRGRKGENKEKTGQDISCPVASVDGLQESFCAGRIETGESAQGKITDLRCLPRRNQRNAAGNYPLPMNVLPPKRGVSPVELVSKVNVRPIAATAAQRIFFISQPSFSRLPC